MDKRETVIESIQKLLALGVSDNEIAENLYDVGIAKLDAVNLIRDAKNAKDGLNAQNASGNAATSSQQKQERSSNDFFEQTVTELSMNEQIVQQLPLDKKAAAEAAAQKSAAKENKGEDIADKIMADVGLEEGDAEEANTTDDGEELEDAVKKTLAAAQSNALNPKPVPVAQTQNPPQSSQAQGMLSPFPQFVQSTPTPSQPLTQQVPLVKKAVPQKSFTEIPNISFNANPTIPRPAPNMESSPDFEELWKKGIVVAVNAKLSEMKRIKDDLDAELAQKVDEAMRKELYQFKVVMDSQKGLMQSSNKEALEQKQREISFIIDAKIAELKQYNKQLNDTVAAIEASRKQQEVMLTQITASLDEAKKLKSQLIVEMNSEMIKSKSQAQAFIDSATTHINQMDERINKTLELEKNIAEGMLAQAEQKIESLTIQRADELIAQMEIELTRLQSIAKKVSPETLDQRIQVLDDFKKQFLTSMQQNLGQINIAITALNEKSVLADRTLQEKTLAIDAKLEELTRFEKEFSDKLSKIFE